MIKNIFNFPSAWRIVETWIDRINNMPKEIRIKQYAPDENVYYEAEVKHWKGHGKAWDSWITLEEAQQIVKIISKRRRK